MAVRKTHYELLGVSRDASSVDIASAFREKLAEAKDGGGIDPQRLESLRDAYQTLASPSRRTEYDGTLSPAAAARAPRTVIAAADKHAAPDGAWRLRLLKYGVPVAIAVVAIWGWKTRPAPEPKMVFVPPVVPASSTPRPESAEPRAAAATAPPAPAATAPLPPRSAEQLFSEVSGSIVRVQAFDPSGRETKQGSGVVFEPGRVVTNCHVIEGAAKVAVKVGKGTRPVRVSIVDEELDLCALDVAGLEAPVANLGTVATVRIGQRVYAIGAPQGFELTISEGIVSSLREVSGSKVIQTTTPVSPGSSGGGLFNAAGLLVGIVTFQHPYGENLNFALPADWIAEMRTRAAAAAPAATAQPSVGEGVLGRWWCFGTVTGRNGEYTYDADGQFRIVPSDGRNVSGKYRVAGRRILYEGGEGAFSFDIESISPDRMVQGLGEGRRLACERR
jgi:hypothetical protein